MKKAANKISAKKTKNNSPKKVTAKKKPAFPAFPAELLEAMQNDLPLSEIMQIFDVDQLDRTGDITQAETEAHFHAFDMLEQVWDANSKAKRVSLAKKILKISPYVVDAHIVLIQETTPLVADKIEATLAAIELGKKFIGKKNFADFYGQLWGYIEARPTMRAYALLARLYIDTGDLLKAKKTYEEILSMNTNDNMGVRYEFLPLLIKMGEWQSAQKLYKNYKDDSVGLWQISAAVIDFVHLKKPDHARKKIETMHAKNPYYLFYLRMPVEVLQQLRSPPYYQIGDVSEAITYAPILYPSILAYPEFKKWLEDVSEDPSVADINKLRSVSSK